MTSSVQVERIVVGVDGSPSSEEALRWALRQAELTGATIEAVTAWEMAPVYSWALIVPDEGAEALARRVQESCIARVSDQDPSEVEVRRLLVQGPAAQVLSEAAQGAQLLVVGTRGHGPLIEALLGSVGQQCVHWAPCPVVIVHGDDEGANEAERS